jgi:hypothetical protein
MKKGGWKRKYEGTRRRWKKDLQQPARDTNGVKNKQATLARVILFFKERQKFKYKLNLSKKQKKKQKKQEGGEESIF